ncbi:MAG: hypothetical protein J6E44_06410, partial [Lachnospiraceae bacterium]|nr:hypothetical protein [Lachnospiraceae bacterium]
AENYERAAENSDDAENIDNTDNSEEIGEDQQEESAEGDEQGLTGQEAETGEDVEGADSEDKKDEDKTGSQDEEPEKAIMPAMSFEDSIRVRTGKPAGVEDGSAGSAAASAAEALPKKAKVTVRVEADEGTFPAGTTMVLSAVEDLDAVAETVKETVESVDGDNNGNTTADTENKNPKTYGFQAVDISFRDADGNEIEPAKPVRVALSSEIVEQIKADKEASENTSIADPVVVHLDDDGNAEKMDLIAPEEIQPAQGKTAEELREEQAAEDENLTNPATDTQGSEGQESPGQAAEEDGEAENSSAFFETNLFSVYAIVYTVDFHWEVDGKEFDFSIPGGGFVSLEHLAEVLGIGTGDANDASDPSDEDVYNESLAENVEDVNAEGTDPVGETDDQEAEDTNENSEINETVGGENAKADESEEAADSAVSSTGIYEEAINLNNIPVSETTRQFVADIEKVEFSTPSLVWVGKVENNSTVGGLKEANELECQYSAELTEEQIAEINAQTVEAGDWALISILPFTSEESLTVTMKDGERFVIHVTDEQIATNVLTADGETYKITVTFTEEAKIPAGTKLVAEEIEPGSEEYLRLLGHTWLEVNKEYLEQQERIYRNDPSNETAEIRPVNIDEVRFFDITFICNGEELEPKAPVQVDIQLVKGLSNSADAPVTGVVHFPSEKTDENAREAVPSDSEDPDGEKPNEEQIELIEQVETVEDKDGALVEFSYEQESFSAVGVYLGQPTYEAGMEPMDPADALPKLTAMRAGEEQESLEPFEASKELT